MTLPLYYTHHGPIVKFDRKRHRAYSVKLPNFEGVNYSTNLYGFMTAKNLEEFKAVVGKQRMPKWNLLYSDARNIYWIHNGTVAKRAEGFDWRKPVPGLVERDRMGTFLAARGLSTDSQPCLRFPAELQHPALGGYQELRPAAARTRFLLPSVFAQG